ncbi:unnamed protein product [Pleuronectes platessa]|uniref:Uncharacterized protein n=1 Tax=Pleuronectes platessa TaxID=8262 RepID=A0A9N7UJ84_PLEPL|nr:unnamed protein product [Pleuronectes platessa]
MRDTQMTDRQSRQTDRHERQTETHSLTFTFAPPPALLIYRLPLTYVSGLPPPLSLSLPAAPQVSSRESREFPVLEASGCIHLSEGAASITELCSELVEALVVKLRFLEDLEITSMRNGHSSLIGHSALPLVVLLLDTETCGPCDILLSLLNYSLKHSELKERTAEGKNPESDVLLGSEFWIGRRWS